MKLINTAKYPYNVIPVNQDKRRYEPFTSGGGGGNNVTNPPLITPVQQVYTVTNVVPDRAYDAALPTTAELAQVLGTLIQDLQTSGIIQ